MFSASKGVSDMQEQETDDGFIVLSSSEAYNFDMDSDTFTDGESGFEFVKTNSARSSLTSDLGTDENDPTKGCDTTYVEHSDRAGDNKVNKTNRAAPTDGLAHENPRVVELFKILQIVHTMNYDMVRVITSTYNNDVTDDPLEKNAVAFTDLADSFKLLDDNYKYRDQIVERISQELGKTSEELAVEMEGIRARESVLTNFTQGLREKIGQLFDMKYACGS